MRRDFISKAAPGDDSTGTVGRVIRLLRVLAEHPEEQTVKGLGLKLDLPPTTVHRLLNLLIPYGMIERHPKHPRYRAGGEYFRLASLVLKQFDVAALARPFLARLLELTRESCILWLYQPASRRIVIGDSLESSHALRYDLYNQAQDRSLTWGAVGRSILAHLSDTEIRQVLASAQPRPTDGALPPTFEQLLPEIQRIRANGYARSEGHLVPGATAIAAPFFNASGAVAGCVGITTPIIRHNMEAERQWVPELITAMREFSRLLGHQGQPRTPERDSAALPIKVRRPKRPGAGFPHVTDLSLEYEERALYERKIGYLVMENERLRADLAKHRPTEPTDEEAVPHG